MLRKLVIGLVAAASLSAAALASTEASARAFGGGRGFGKMGGFGGHHAMMGGGWRGGHGFGRAALGVGLGLELISTAIAASSCKQLVTTSGRVVTIC